MNGEEEREPASGRLFVAIETPDYVAAAVRRLQTAEKRARGLRWVAPEKLHLTLAFLGEVEPERQWELFERLPKVPVTPFFLTIEGLGVFPRKGSPQVLWTGLAPADPRLFQLHAKVEQLLLDLGFQTDKRRYHPHVTLARCGPGGGSEAIRIAKKHADFGAAPFKVEGFGLYASQLTSQGAQYRTLLRMSF